MKIDFNVFGQPSSIQMGTIVDTIYNKQFIVVEILDDTKFLGFSYPDYRGSSAFLEVDDVIEVMELPKNVTCMVFKRMEKIVDDAFKEMENESK